MSNYWRRRIQEENEANLRKSNVEVQKLLRKLYRAESTTLFHKLESTFSKILKDAAEENVVHLNDLYLTDKFYTLIEYFNQCASRIGGKQVKITEDSLINIYELAHATVTHNVPAAAIPTTFTVPSSTLLEETAKQAVRRTWCIDGKNFSERIWTNKQALVQDLTRTMIDYAAQGTSPYNMAQGIVERLAVDESNAYRLARTELAHFQVASQVEKYKELGFTQGIFRSEDPCDECGTHDGKTYPLDELERMIPLHPNCECSFDILV